MGRESKQQYLVSSSELEQLAATEALDRASLTINRCGRMESRGGRPVVYYSDHHGFLILDVNDPEDARLNRLIESHALPFAARMSTPGTQVIGRAGSASRPGLEADP